MYTTTTIVGNKSKMKEAYVKKTRAAIRALLRMSNTTKLTTGQSSTARNLMIVKCVRPMIVLFDLFIPYPGHKRLVIVAHMRSLCVKAKLSKNEVSNQLIVVS